MAQNTRECKTCGGEGTVTHDLYSQDTHRYEPVGVRVCPDCGERGIVDA